MLLSLRVQICLLSSVEFPRRVCRNEAVWFLYLVLKSFSVSLMYVSVVLLSFRVTVAWQTTDDCRQFPMSGHAFFCQQLHDLLFFVLSAVSSLECNGIRFRRVLFVMEGRLGQMMPCPMIMITVVCWCRQECSLWWSVGGCSRSERIVVKCSVLWMADKCFG